MALNDHVCKVCSLRDLDEVTEFRTFPRVTSDCVPFRAGGRLLICHYCNAVQSPADAQWFAEIDEIYSSYHAYHQSGGVEQRVLDASMGGFTRRSVAILSHLLALPYVPKSGKVLDVGCGGGATLRVFSERGDWRLHGMEVNAKTRPLLEQINGFEALYTCPPADLPTGFDLVTMVHALEHFPEPLTTLRNLKGKIAGEGCLFVEVPNAEANPFDYVIADHMMHFTPSSLRSMAAQAGFAVDCISTNWVAKELSLTARPSKDRIAQNNLPGASRSTDGVYKQIDWLQRFVEAASEEAMTASGGFGLFGTSIAATWLCSVLGDKVDFFAEEDLSRIGRLHMGRPILSPTEVKPKDTVFMALTPQIATQIAARLAALPMQLKLPPRFSSLDRLVD